MIVGLRIARQEKRSDRRSAEMIISNRRHMFGFGNYGVVRGTTFGCAVSTASEGFLKGYSTVFLAFEDEGPNLKNKRLVAKALLNPSLSRKQKTGIHDTFLTHLDTLESAGIDLAAAIDEVLNSAKNRHAVVNSINEARPPVNEGAGNITDAIDALHNRVESNRLQVEADAQRLLALINEVANRIGEAPVCYNDDGKVFVHPDLALELDKPGNEALSEMLITGARMKARRQD
jgi:hypothetical protein